MACHCLGHCSRPAAGRLPLGSFGQFAVFATGIGEVSKPELFQLELHSALRMVQWLEELWGLILANWVLLSTAKCFVSVWSTLQKVRGSTFSSFPV